MEPAVYFIDVTNRDGVQTSRILLPKLAKTMINLYLDEMGIFQSEIGFPTLRHEVNYINANLELEKAEYKKGQGFTIVFTCGKQTCTLAIPDPGSQKQAK